MVFDDEKVGTAPLDEDLLDAAGALTGGVMHDSPQ